MMKGTEASCDMRLLYSFFNIHKNLVRLAKETAASNGLTMPQFSVLMMIAPHKKMTQKILGERMFMPKSTLSQAVESLVKAGFIRRRPVEGNRRELELILSDEGEAFFNDLLSQEDGVAKCFSRACHALSEQQYRQLLEAHEVLAEVLKKQGEIKSC